MQAEPKTHNPTIKSRPQFQDAQVIQVNLKRVFLVGNCVCFNNPGLQPGFFWDFKQRTLDLHLHDTYFVFTNITIILPVFFFLTFLLFLIRSIRKKFVEILPNGILLVSGLLLILMLAFESKKVIKLGAKTGGWTSYPPLSAMPQQVELQLNPVASEVADVFTILQIIVTIILLYSVFQWGKRTKGKIGVRYQLHDLTHWELISL